MRWTDRVFHEIMAIAIGGEGDGVGENEGDNGDDQQRHKQRMCGPMNTRHSIVTA